LDTSAPGHLDSFLDPKGQRGHRVRGLPRQADEIQHLHRALPCARFSLQRFGQRCGGSEEAAADVDVVSDEHVLEHRHRPEQGEVLKGARQASPHDLVRRKLEHRLAVE